MEPNGGGQERTSGRTLDLLISHTLREQLKRMENEEPLTKRDLHLESQIRIERTVKAKSDVKKTIAKKLQKGCSCSSDKLKNLITGFFPVLYWLPRYKLKEWILGDTISGILVAVVIVPQAIAYALLAGLETSASLYTSFFSCIIYFLMGTSRHISVGIFSLICLIVGQVVDRELLLAGFEVDEDSKVMPLGMSNANNWNITNDNASMKMNVTLPGLLSFECDKKCYAVSVSAALTFMCGIYQLLMAIFHLGFVSKYLSEPLLDGFATGASITIVTMQVKYLIGVKLPRSHGPGSVVVTWINIFKNIHKTNLCDLITTAICMPLLIASKELGERYKNKLKFPFPMELTIVVIATLISHFVNLNELYGSSITGPIPTGFLPPKVPSLYLLPRVAIDAITLAIISFAFTISLAELFAKKHGYTIHANQETYALGFCNVIQSFFHSYASSATLVKTLVKDSSGCQTQLSSLVSAVLVLMLLLFLAPVFYSLQKCVLASIIIVSLRGALMKFRDLPKLWKMSKIDTVVWWVTMLSVVLISTELGLFTGVTFSILCVIVRTQLPRTALLGRMQDSTLYEDQSEYNNLTSVPQIKIFRFEAALYYANKDYFLDSLMKKVGLNPALEIAKQKKAESKQNEKKKAGKTFSGNINQEQSIVIKEMIPKNYNFHTIILDCSTIQFLDTVGINTMKMVLQDYNDIGIRILLARCNPSVIDSLSRGEYFGENCKEMYTLLFYSVDAAVQYAEAQWSASGNSTL
ncbi:sulfate anion transporter 1 isoform X3 [Hypanus sabinus]|uniref:sulfate anion transporter 1 isoform X3 n=1 Tax=Hypanus sabinus TaxID=79690 RepID=UPI0028C38B97|nr:sulfate anion transporter 1 isoform X3 [Hypanus sabinus]